MIKHIFTIIILGFLCFSCKKEKEQEIVESPPLKDVIIYKDIEPDIEISTIRTFTTNSNPFCTSLPVPNDSSAFFELDLDEDSKMDFLFKVSHYQIQVNGYCGHCDVHHVKSIQVTPLTPNGFISMPNSMEIRNYDSTKAILSTHQWNNSAAYSYYQPCGGYSPYFDHTYWGLKLNDMIAWIHVERIGKNGLRIKEFAYNKTKNYAISAGQKQ